MSETLRDEVLDLLRDVLIAAPGATRELAEHHLANVMREFTRQTNIWTEHQELVTVEGAPEYALAAPCPDAVIGWVLAAQYESRDLAVWAPPYGHAMAALQTTDTQTGPPRAVASPSPGIVRLGPIPDGGYRVQLIVSLIATGLTAPLPPNLLLLFHDTLRAGTLSRLYAMPSSPFSSATLAEFYGRKFRSGMVDARISGTKGLSAGFQHIGFSQKPAGMITR